jgi:hypothetical protein
MKRTRPLILDSRINGVERLRMPATLTRMDKASGAGDPRPHSGKFERTQ